MKDQEKLMAVIYLVQEKGLAVAQRMKWVKKIDSEIYEIRSQVSSNIQRALYFRVSGNRYVITHGFTKKTQKTPVSEINHAKMLKKNLRRMINIATVKFNDYLSSRLQNDNFKEGFLKENAILESALAVYRAR